MIHKQIQNQWKQEYIGVHEYITVSEIGYNTQHFYSVSCSYFSVYTVIYYQGVNQNGRIQTEIVQIQEKIMNA